MFQGVVAVNNDIAKSNDLWVISEFGGDFRVNSDEAT